MTGLIRGAVGGYVNVRRVVTGHDQNGKAVFVSDAQVQPITASLVPGIEFHRLWGSDTASTFPARGNMPSFGTYFPPVGGFRVWFFSLPPRRHGTSEETAAAYNDPAVLM